MAAHAIKFTRRRALKTVDRLFFIAHDEQGPPAITRTFACVEFCCDGPDHRPLFRAGVLRLVDQNMIDAAIQSVKRPLRHFR